MMNRQVYGYVNGKAVYSGEDFVFEKRGFGPISDDTALIAYAEKVTRLAQRRLEAHLHHVLPRHLRGQPGVHEGGVRQTSGASAASAS